MNLIKIFSELTTNLDKLDKGRETILPKTRSIIRDCSNAIKHIHRKEFDLYNEKISLIKQTHTELKEIVI
jgi:predicted translin family RNA/ssDNA-binding protein